MNKKLLPVVVTISLVLSFSLAIPVAANMVHPPLPEELWSYNTSGNVTDIAVGDLNKDDKDDVVAIDDFFVGLFTLHAIPGEGPGAWQWQDSSIAGYAVAIGDINGDGWNEVIAGGENYIDGVAAGEDLRGGFGTTKIIYRGNVINAYDKDGTILWSYRVTGEIKDIEIGDVDNDGKDDVVACNNEVLSVIYAVNGTGDNITGWPVTPGTTVVDLAVGQLDGKGGVDVAAIGDGLACLYVYNSTGYLMWLDTEVGGRAVEIGNVDGDDGNEVVAVAYDTESAFGGFGQIPGGWVLAFDGDEGGAPLYSFYTEDYKVISDIELGDLDGDPEDVEVAAITPPTDATIFAIDIDSPPAGQEMWRYSIDWWHGNYYGESIAIGDIDRDYRNEVIAGTSAPDRCIYAFDGIDMDGDGQGDLVWSPYCVDPRITDVEVGDLDGDGDDDVAFGTEGGETIYAITAVESKTGTATGSGTVYFDSDPSTLEGLTAVAESELPEEGKPNLAFPHGFFSFNITLLSANHTSAIVTMTFPSPLPVGTQYWKYGPTPSDPSDHWYQLLVGDNDGDNVITITLVDGGLGDDNVVAPDGLIVDQGGPGTPITQPPVGGEAYPVSRISVLAPWIVVAVAVMVGAGVFVLRRRRS